MPRDFNKSCQTSFSLLVAWYYINSSTCVFGVPSHIYQHLFVLVVHVSSESLAFLIFKYTYTSIFLSFYISFYLSHMIFTYNYIVYVHTYIYIYTVNAWALPGPAMTTGDASSSSSSSSATLSVQGSPWDLEFVPCCTWRMPPGPCGFALVTDIGRAHRQGIVGQFETSLYVFQRRRNRLKNLHFLLSPFDALWVIGDFFITDGSRLSPLSISSCSGGGRPSGTAAELNPYWRSSMNVEV